jgi:hypothetical protein
MAQMEKMAQILLKSATKLLKTHLRLGTKMRKWMRLGTKVLKWMR